MSPLEQMAEMMNRLDFVVWDKQVPRASANQEIVYGFIDRPGSTEGRCDFVVLFFEVREGDDVVVGSLTSAPEYAEQISRQLFGTTTDTRVYARPIEDVFSGLVKRTVERKPPAAWRDAA